LKGPAASIISSLNSTAENYTLAWKLLDERYKQNRTALFDLFAEITGKQFFDLHSDLYTLVDKLNRIKGQAEQLTVPFNASTELLLIYLLSCRFNDNLKTLFNREFFDKNALISLDEFTTFLKRHSDTVANSPIKSRLHF